MDEFYISYWHPKTMIWRLLRAVDHGGTSVMVPTKRQVPFKYVDELDIEIDYRPATESEVLLYG